MTFHFALFSCFWVLITSVVAKNKAPSNSVPLKLINYAGSPIELFWVDIYTNIGALVKQTQKPLRNSSATYINSYDTHKFVVKFLDPNINATAEFVKGPKEETFTVYYDPATATMNVTLTTKLSEIVDTVNQATTKCKNLIGTSEFSSCIAAGIIDDVNYITDAKTTMASYRDLMSAKLRNYTCADETLNTTEPISSYQIAIEEKEYTIDILLNMTHAKIWKIDNFITPEECSVLEEHGRSRLTRATVAAEDGSSVISPSRKANQASYNLHKVNPESDPLWGLFQRVLGLTNYHAGMNLQPPGQEDFTIIQYNVEDQYFNHCDGTCDDSIHIPRGRVATAVLYCKGPDGRMDDGYTEHSGCPVLAGEKMITVMWMRDGVDDEHPWTMYDPNGVKMLD